MDRTKKEAAPQACVICNSMAREKLIERDGWQVYRCAACGLGILDPRPTKEEVIKLYNKEYFTEPGQGGIEPDTTEFRHRLGLESARVRLVRSRKKRGCILDIGCGNAYFLAACRRKGFTVQGMDLSDYAVSYAREKLRLQISVGEVADVKLPTNHFDVITMWHFLEHTGNPRQVVETARQWLKKDGILVIDVPNYQGTDAQAAWQEWVGWQLPYHFFHFTPESLKLLLQATGFRAVKTKSYHSETIKNRLKKLPIVSLFARQIACFYSGTSIAMVAQRTDEL